MAGEVLARPDELRDRAAEVTACADGVATEVAATDVALSDLGEQFRGVAATTFEQRYRTWSGAADRLLESLGGLGRFLSGAGEAFEGTDEALASSVGGGGAAQGVVAADVEALRSTARSLDRLSGTFDGDARTLLSRLGLDAHEIGGHRTHAALGHFQGDWSDARKDIVRSADAAHSFLTSAARSFEELDRDLRSALEGGGGAGGGGGGGGGGGW